MENLQTPMLAFEPQVHPEIPQRFIGEKIWLPGRTHQLHYHLRTFELRQADDFPHSTNVALAAFNLAARMGCDPIIFVGLDLCFSEPGGASHAAAAALRANVRLDSPHGRLSYRRGDRQDEVEVVWVEGVDGNPYPSTSHFLEALRLLETLIHRQHALCIDATEGGARIAGTQLLPLQQALENFCRSEIAPSAVLRRCPRLRRSASLRQSVLAIAEYLESCDRLASEALALLETDADLSPDRLRTLDDYRGRIEQGQKLYQVLENSLERLIVEIDRPGFWDDPTIPPAERTRRYVWYFSQVHLAAQTGAALYLQAAEALAVDEEGSLPGGSELGKISPKT
jgi:hypothetical protein